jgi:hypothetical protein
MIDGASISIFRRSNASRRLLTLSTFSGKKNATQFNSNSPPARTRSTSTPGAPGPGSTSTSNPARWQSRQRKNKGTKRRRRGRRSSRSASRAGSAPKGPTRGRRPTPRCSSIRSASPSLCPTLTCLNSSCRRWRRRQRRRLGGRREARFSLRRRPPSARGGAGKVRAQCPSQPGAVGVRGERDEGEPVAEPLDGKVESFLFFLF